MKRFFYFFWDGISELQTPNAEKPEIFDFIVFRVPDSRIRGFGTSSKSYEN